MYERNPRYTFAPIWDHAVTAASSGSPVAFSTNIGTTAGLGTLGGQTLGAYTWSYSVAEVPPAPGTPQAPGYSILAAGLASGGYLGPVAWSYSVIGTAVANVAFVPRRNGRRRPNSTSL